MAHAQPARLTLEPRQVYGLTMYPGYGDGPYRSPILVEAVTPLSNGRFDLEFINIFYAAGVQRMTYTLRTLRREQTCIIAAVLRDGMLSDRTVVIEAMSPSWVEDNVRKSAPLDEQLFDQSRQPIPEAFMALCNTAW